MEKKIFLDTNIFIDLIEGRDLSFQETLAKYPLFLSVVSPLVTAYVYKYAIPNKKIETLLEDFNIVFSNQAILAKSLIGPTADLEDNLQLHSAVFADCEIFLTKDKNLLRLGYFGNLRICESLEEF